MLTWKNSDFWDDLFADKTKGPCWDLALNILLINWNSIHYDLDWQSKISSPELFRFRSPYLKSFLANSLCVFYTNMILLYIYLENNSFFVRRTVKSLCTFFYLIRYLKVIFRQLKTYLSEIQISFLRKLGTPADINFILQNFCVHEMNENNKFHMWCLGDKFLYFLYYIGRTFYWFFRFSASSSHY